MHLDFFWNKGSTIQATRTHFYQRICELFVYTQLDVKLHYKCHQNRIVSPNRHRVIGRTKSTTIPENGQKLISRSESGVGDTSGVVVLFISSLDIFTEPLLMQAIKVFIPSAIQFTSTTSAEFDPGLCEHRCKISIVRDCVADEYIYFIGT